MFVSFYLLVFFIAERLSTHSLKGYQWQRDNLIKAQCGKPISYWVYLQDRSDCKPALLFWSPPHCRWQLDGWKCGMEHSFSQSLSFCTVEFLKTTYSWGILFSQSLSSCTLWNFQRPLVAGEGRKSHNCHPWWGFYDPPLFSSTKEFLLLHECSLPRASSLCIVCSQFHCCQTKVALFLNGNEKDVTLRGEKRSTLQPPDM